MDDVSDDDNLVESLNKIFRLRRKEEKKKRRKEEKNKRRKEVIEFKLIHSFIRSLFYSIIFYFIY